MRKIFQSFVDRLMDSTNADELRQGMAETASALDLCCFAYLFVSPQPSASPLLISNYPPTWTSHYLQERYHEFDPVIAEALRRPLPFEWGPSLGPAVHTERARDLFEEAARFGIRHGFTVPVHDSTGAIAAITFATDKRRASFVHAMTRDAQVLQLIAMYFHAHARRKLRQVHSVNGVTLSRREIECLNWAAQGKSAWEIGRIIGISRHTVVFHLDNARAKLGVRSTIQAVARLAATNPDP